MTLAIRRIAALAAVLTPSSAGRLLSLLSDLSATDQEAPSHAAALAARPRGERLAALAAVVPAAGAVDATGRLSPGGELLRRLIHDASVLRRGRDARR